jgi:hypothetical protein
MSQTHHSHGENMGSDYRGDATPWQNRREARDSRLLRGCDGVGVLV